MFICHAEYAARSLHLIFFRVQHPKQLMRCFVHHSKVQTADLIFCHKALINEGRLSV